MMDIDFFKLVNNTYSHATGDQILRRFAAEVGAHIRLGDKFGRGDGEEFVILLHDVDQSAVIALAERIRASVQAMDTLPAENTEMNKLPAITISMGLVSTGELESYNLKNLMQHAGQALYQAKKAGRNQVIAAIIDPEPAQLKLSTG
jgi:diguanylate cyclase (GGDEF)-like protein